ncbi:fimbrial protein [Pseudomonas sp. R2.Fl]|nr:fimbrial protein [Pseudomonas sp. R2.Fl]
MSKSLLGLSVLILAGASGSAMAADGAIKFTGEIIASSCTMQAGSGGTPEAAGKTLAIDLGKVGADSLSEGGGQGNIGAAKNIDIKLDCQGLTNGLKNVHLSFKPNDGTGTGMVPNSRLLAVTAGAGSATGVGIGVFDKDNVLLDLNDSLTKITGQLGPITNIGTEEAPRYQANANLALRAAYVKIGADPVVPGKADGYLPFQLSYD